MSALSISPPFPIFSDSDGTALENGYIWIGTANLNPIVNPINVYWDAALTVAAVQPIRTLNGYPMYQGTPARLYVNSDYSIQVQNRNGSVVYSAPAATEAFGNLINASQVVYDPAGTGAVATTVQAKLRESVSDADFGAVGDGIADDTSALLALFSECVEAGEQINLTKPAYKVSGAILPSTSRTGSRTLNINCDVPVTITYDSGAAGLLYFIYLNTTAENNVVFTGSPLTFNGSNKCATFMRCDHNGADNTGVVDIQSKVIIKNLKNTDASSTVENGGIIFSGPYSRVVINEPEVDTVERTNVSGTTAGIVVTQFTGVVDIYSPKVSRVLTPGTVDADGIKVFGKPVAGVLTDKRQGVCNIHDGVYTDNEGRHIKVQCSEVSINNPVSIRQNVVTITSSADFDFQCGNGLLSNPVYIYKKNGATSPLGTSHSPVIFQQLIENEEMVAVSDGGKMITETGMPRYCLVTHSAGAEASVTRVKGLRVLPSAGLATTVFTESIMLTAANTIEAKSTQTTLEVSDCSGPIPAYGIGYTSYGGTALTAKLNVIVANNENTLTSGTLLHPFYKLSGTTIRALKSFLFKNNTGFRSLYTDLDFTVNTMPVGCVVVVDLATCTVTGMPAWAAAGFGTFQCIDQYFGATGRTVWAIKGSATVANTMYFTQDGGTTWGQIK